MAAHSDENDVVPMTPDEAFAVFGNETRLGILRGLWDAYDPSASDNAVPFSELYDRVDTDDTGNFNYHLGKLTDHFVRRTETGYELTLAGFEVVRAVVAGTVSERPRIDSTEIDADCPRCGAPVEVAYEDQAITARCTRCIGLWRGADDSSGYLFRFPLPPVGLVDRTPEAAFHATVDYNLGQIRSFRNGVCPHCSGVVEESVEVCDSHDPDERDGCRRCGRHHMVQVVTVCRRCKAETRGPLTIAILLHPVVTAFYHDNGVDHRFESWASFVRGHSCDEELVETDPLRLRVTIPCEDERLELLLDESLSIVDITR